MHHPSVFKSFFLGGFECSNHRRSDGRRLDLLAATGHDRWAAHDYAESQAPFELWFKGKVLELCGVDANRQPEGPPAKPLFDWPGLA